MARGKHGPSVRCVFMGEVFRRYPDSTSRTLRVYFANKHRRRLHRAIWEHHNGPVPAGYHVHHRDDDPLNNHLANLEAKPGGEHLSEHMRTPERIAMSRANIHKAIAAAPAWHASPEGLEWHRQNARAVILARPLLDFACVECGGRRDPTPTPVRSARCAEGDRLGGVADLARRQHRHRGGGLRHAGRTDPVGRHGGRLGV